MQSRSMLRCWGNDEGGSEKHRCTFRIDGDELNERQTAVEGREVGVVPGLQVAADAEGRQWYPKKLLEQHIVQYPVGDYQEARKFIEDLLPGQGFAARTVRE